MENPTIFKNGKPGKPSISIRAIFHHLYHGYVSHNQRVPAIYGNLNGLSEPCDFGVTFSWQTTASRVSNSFKLQAFPTLLDLSDQIWCRDMQGHQAGILLDSLPIIGISMNSSMIGISMIFGYLSYSKQLSLNFLRIHSVTIGLSIQVNIPSQL